MSAASDFRLHHGNDLEILAELLARALAEPVEGAPLLAPDVVLVPQPAMRRWLAQVLARRHGVAANIEFLTPGEWVARVLADNLGGDDAAVADAAVLRWRLWRELADPRLREDPRFSPLHASLAADARAPWQLAGELAHAFERYQAWRRGWLLDWDRGGGADDWQAELWRRATRGLAHRAARIDRYLARHAGDDAPPPRMPPRLFAFACQNVSPDVLRIIATQARAGTLHFYVFSPVAGWWGDLETARERLSAPEGASRFGDDENPLLRANGAAGRDFVRTLFSYDVVHPTWEQSIYEPPDPARRPGLLHRLQRDLLARRAPVPDHAWRIDDRSLQLHACHTRLREVQVLHDQLRALFEADPTLDPRDVAVLTPDIDAYAPHVRAVFGDGAIAYTLAERSAVAATPLAQWFLRLLALPSSRFAAEEVVEMLSLRPVAERLALSSADVDLLRHWIAESGARWGRDAAHRAASGAPDDETYTWRWALDRLLLGAAAGDDVERCGLVAWPDLEGGQLDTLDALLSALRVFESLAIELDRAQPAASWARRLELALEALLPARAVELHDRDAIDRLRGHVAAFADEASRAGIDGDVAPDVVRAWFAEALHAAERRAPLIGAGVTFARMVPMRLIPFRVIALLGMDDDAFPRRDVRGTSDRLTAELDTPRRRAGDRSVREDDRYLFLQLLASAQDVFYVSWRGRDPRSGEAQPPSVVVGELIDVVARCSTDGERVRSALVVEHPLHPFAPEAFGRGDARRIGFDAAWHTAAGATAASKRALPPFAPIGTPMPARDAEEHPAATITRDELYAALAHPPRCFLRHRLGLRLADDASTLSDSEPFDRDALRAHGLAQRVLEHVSDVGADVDADALFRRLLAEARVAPAAAGRDEVDAAIARLLPLAVAYRDWRRGPARREPYAIALGDTTLVGTLPQLHDGGLAQLRPGRPHGRAQLALGIDWLAWSALGGAGSVFRALPDEPVREIAPMPATDARDALAALCALAQDARRQALPLMPRSGWSYACAIADGRDADAARRAAFADWRGRNGHGEGDDAWTRLALRGRDPFDEPADGPDAIAFATLSQRLFAPLLGARA